MWTHCVLKSVCVCLCSWLCMSVRLSVHVCVSACLCVCIFLSRSSRANEQRNERVNERMKERRMERKGDRRETSKEFKTKSLSQIMFSMFPVWLCHTPPLFVFIRVLCPHAPSLSHFLPTHISFCPPPLHPRRHQPKSNTLLQLGGPTAGEGFRRSGRAGAWALGRGHTPPPNPPSRQSAKASEELFLGILPSGPRPRCPQTCPTGVHQPFCVLRSKNQPCCMKRFAFCVSCLCLSLSVYVCLCLFIFVSMSNFEPLGRFQLRFPKSQGGHTHKP